MIFILIFLCVLHACQQCDGPSMNVYAMLVWTWILTVFLFAVFGVFIGDELTQILYMGSVVAISVLFLVFIVVWAIVDTYGCVKDNDMHLHQLLHKLSAGKM